MKTVVACIDNSAATRAVLTAAGALARILGASVEAVHVVEDGDVTVRAAADDAGVPLRVLQGDPPDELVAAAMADGVVAVAVGARDRPSGRRAVGHLVFALANRVASPVLVVPPNADTPERMHRVLLAMEGTASRTRPLQQGIELASPADVELVVVHVDDELSIPRFSDQPQHETNAYGHEFLARFLPGAPRAQLELRVGVPADEILRAAESTEPDLVAIGWPQTDDPSRGLVARELLERCPVPMLLVALADL